MITNIHRRLQERHDDNEEGGFTLIELMVVVLIIGILMAIAIPTFLNLTSSAKTNAAQADLTTAIQDEGAYITAQSTYGQATDMTGTNGPDQSLNWVAAGTAGASGCSTTSAGSKCISVNQVSTTAGSNEVILSTLSGNGFYYWADIYQGKATYAKGATAKSTAQPATTTGAGFGSTTLPT